MSLAKSAEATQLSGGHGETAGRIAQVPADMRILRRPGPEGESPPKTVVMVHGAMDRATSFTRLMAKLPEWEAVAYDRRGYGHSAGLAAPGDFAVQVEDLVEIAGAGPVVAFGHSLGGDIVLAALQSHPRVFSAALIWEAPMPWMPFWPDDTASRGAAGQLSPDERAEWFMRRMVGDKLWERLPAATRAARRSEGVTLQTDFAYLSHGPVFDATAITVPVTVGYGGKSRPHQRAAAHALAEALPGGQLVCVPEAGHGAHLTHPAVVADLIRELPDPCDRS